MLSILSLFLAAAACGLAGLNSNQRHRPALFSLLLIFNLLTFYSLLHADLPIDVKDTLAKFLIIFSAHMGCVLLIEKHVLSSTTSNWKEAYGMLFNARWIGTERQIPDVGQIDKRRVTKFDNGLLYLISLLPPSLHLPLHAIFKTRRRFHFVIKRIISLFSIIVVEQLHSYLIANYMPPFTISDVQSSKQVFFRRFLPQELSSSTLGLPSTRETFIRCWLVFQFIWYGYALYTSLHAILSIFFVGTGIDSPEEWPPLYGSLKEAYTIQRFWGKFWHKLVYRSYSSYGSIISLHFFRLPRDSRLGKLFVHFFVFFLSGGVHAVVTKSLGFTCGYWEDIWFFMASFIAILLELMAQEIFGRFYGRPMKWKVVGYFWVFVFLFWSLPKAAFPKARCQPVHK